MIAAARLLRQPLSRTATIRQRWFTNWWHKYADGENPDNPIGRKLAQMMRKDKLDPYLMHRRDVEDFRKFLHQAENDQRKKNESVDVADQKEKKESVDVADQREKEESARKKKLLQDPVDAAAQWASVKERHRQRYAKLVEECAK
eukprot:GEMP01118616.1.p1 GENE.GEMP01118616.1~~GEMP01118616.1.p1  ORF type:complete len:145 (+),score=39.56 GEMP01118616.1:131-565(+)